MPSISGASALACSTYRIFAILRSNNNGRTVPLLRNVLSGIVDVNLTHLVPFVESLKSAASFSCSAVNGSLCFTYFKSRDQPHPRSLSPSFPYSLERSLN